MPKVFLKESDRSQSRFRKMYQDKKSERDLTDAKVAKLLGISQQAANSKLRYKGTGQTNISLTDALTVLNAMKATKDEVLSLCWWL